MKRFLTICAALLLPVTAAAQDRAQPRLALDAEQTEQCVTMMAGFPDETPEARYVFFRLSQELAKDVTPELSRLMAAFMAQNETRRLPADWPMIDVVEDIADPVLRQAAPSQTVASMAHIAYFDAMCGRFVQGQVDSLRAFDPVLADNDLVIREDALYLRQILAEALDRLGGGDKRATQIYTASLIVERDDIEYVGFEDEVDELEALYMGDLDTKLARSNDAVNEGVDVNGYKDAVALANDMDDQARKRAEQERLYSLVRILGGRG
ncbi:hypothetical protein [uncultured Algimonas sp.]|uniref:hypothetical protein n=1 Tax=uncultured Algimonas sp. TaxID=1547920 RepID=UPI0026343EB2|nr:hypothetical protein [uncultured Algimonas sp.]